MTFAKLNLDKKILQAIEKCGYTKPTPVQAKAIPSIIEGKDLIASAQTGTGKTASYVLPALQLLLNKKATRKPHILILAPTRELAGQITKVIGKYGSFMKPRLASFVGGVSYHKQLKELSGPIDIVIATPGRLMDHMKNGRLDLSEIKMLVIDEADRMLDMGFIDDIKIIVADTPKTRQTLLFSATADDKLISLMKNLLKNPVRINISEDKVDTNLIKQKIRIVGNSNKKQILEEIIETESIYKAIIFSATKLNAAKLATYLTAAGHSASAMHGDMKQSARNRTLARFREGKIQFLIATDVAARGIDVTDITHVINYDLPKFAEDYVHRIGRTGRAGKTGLAISIALKSEVHQIRRIERYIDDKIPMVQVTQDGEKEWHPSKDESSAKPNSRRSKQKSGRKPSSKSSGHKFGNRKSDSRKSDERKPSSRKPSEHKFGGRKSDDTKPSSRKPSERKFGGRKSDESKPSSRKPSERKFGERKSDDSKPSSRKPSERKFGERKSDDSKPSSRKPSERTFGGRKSDDSKPSSRKPSERTFGGPKSDDSKPSSR